MRALEAEIVWVPKGLAIITHSQTLKIISSMSLGTDWHYKAALYLIEYLYVNKNKKEIRDAHIKN